MAVNFKARLSVGDIDGDGISDIAVSTYAGFRPNWGGSVYILYGTDEALPEEAFFYHNRMVGGVRAKYIGISEVIGNFDATIAGDVDNDGKSDLVFGSPIILTESTSAVYVVDNANEATIIKTFEDPGWSGSVFWTEGDTDGPYPFGDLFGYSVASGGDLNGDGIDDIVVGAPLADVDGMEDAGAVYVIFGSEAGFGTGFDASLPSAYVGNPFPNVYDTASGLDGTSGFLIVGIGEGDMTGTSVAVAGDLNGDGIDDMLIGAPSIDGTGKVHVVYGRDSSLGTFPPVLDLSALDGSNGFTLTGDAGSLGNDLTAAGDVNGDGLVDIIISGQPASSMSYVIFGSSGVNSAVIDVSQLDGTNGFALSGLDQYGFAYSTVAGIGDIDGDGYDDIAVGGYGGVDGRDMLFVVRGSGDPFAGAVDLSAIDGINGWVFEGFDVTDVGNSLSISPAVDFNNDGVDDLFFAYTMSKDAYALASHLVFGGASNLSAFDNADAVTDGHIDINNLNIDPALISGAEAMVLTDGDDIFNSSNEPINELINAGNGDDIVNAGRGNDVLLGGEGDDVLKGQQGNDFLKGGSGNDVMSGGGGKDHLDGGTGDDRLFGGNSDDQLFGDDGDDLLVGGNGNDVLTGGFGADTLMGQEGDDILYAGPEAGYDAVSNRLIGGTGDDVMYASLLTTTNLDTADVFVFSIGDGNDTIVNYNFCKIEFEATGLTFDDLLIEQVGDDVLISYSETDSITLIGELYAYNNIQEENFIFT